MLNWISKILLLNTIIDGSLIDSHTSNSNIIAGTEN